MSPDNSKSPDHNFTGLVEDWDDRVFNNADHFRVHRFHGNGAHDTFEHESYAVAMVAAVDAMKAGARVIIYAITDTGRYQALVPKRWVHYSKLWMERQDAIRAHGRGTKPVPRDKRPRR